MVERVCKKIILFYYLSFSYLFIYFVFVVVIWKGYSLSLPSFVICRKPLAQFTFTISFWSVGLWHKEIDSSPSSEDKSSTSSWKQTKSEKDKEGYNKGQWWTTLSSFSMGGGGVDTNA